MKAILQTYNSKNLYFFITRGVPGCGKSTFVSKYMSKITKVIESDIIRESINGRCIENGREFINQNNGSAVWLIVDKEIEVNLKDHISITLDATNISKWQLDKYKKLAEKYKAEYIIIDFSNVSLDEALMRNSLRLPEYKRVPDKVIERMYRDIIKQNSYLTEYTALHDKDEVLSWLQNVINRKDS